MVANNPVLAALQAYESTLPDNGKQLFSQYYANLPEEDYAERETADWAGAALAHWRFAGRRAKGDFLLRVYNPTLPEHGWQTSHTVVELVLADMPFLVDTVAMALGRLGHNIHLVVHPVLQAVRDADGQLQQLDEHGAAESWMHFEIDRATSAATLKAIHDEISRALSDLHSVVADWPAMNERVNQALTALRSGLPPIPADEVDETVSFLDWLLDGHFVFLGCRDYRFSSDGSSLDLVPGSGLGLLRDRGEGGPSRLYANLPEDLRKLAYAADHLLVLTKADTRSTIHRPVYLDMISLKAIDDSGKVVAELRILGLYTASAYSAPPRQVPILRRKIEQVLQMSQASLSGHRGKALMHVLDTYPREELVEIDVAELARIANGIVGLHERSRVRVFFREDIYRRYVSVMLFVPRDNYTTEVRIKAQELLTRKLGGDGAEFNVLLSDSPLARIHFIVRLPHGHRPSYDARDIEVLMAELAQRWQDELKRQLLQHCGEELGADRFQQYQRAFPAAYCADFPARVAVHDIDALDAALAGNTLLATLSPGNATDTLRWRLKLYRSGEIALSDCLPLLENLGVRVLDERPYALHFDDGKQAWIIDIGLQLPSGTQLESPAARQRLIDAFGAVFAGQADNDGFNRLVLVAGLAWRDVLVLRAYARFLKQIGQKYAVETLAETLLRYPGYAATLTELFNLRLNPAAPQAEAAEALDQSLHALAVAQTSVDDEKILNGFRAAISATVRTNHFQTDGEGQPKSYLSFKLASARIPGIPQPAPLFEIFVFSTDMEGTHLRGGKVARGGLRWSDRREDFRTEVLGLVKAQMVKNSVIVPVGSKGGFIVKNPPAEREAFLAKGVECYKTLIRGMLDLTDNLQDGRIVPPPQVHRLDEDDPYLVVAADKGTATFSDIANGIAHDYGFWLDDAFASGGSVGYDHKKMGITARGAWVSVQRHFSELGIDVAADPITIVGIGDMSGDVFGNGLLRSQAVKLVAAFDHRHIFIDPTPDPARSFAERERLFALPRSSWADYDGTLISEGGGVWPRSAKTIPLSPQVQALLGVQDNELEPSALLQALLKAPVDLLYNGGIGTYVKASTQSHAEANDRSNDALRIDGRDLRCKVVAEGGNLGFTQLGRIEYALAGGRILTDAIDNSAGVDCSDHEVNIKILLGRIVAAGDLTLKQRNQVLADMTDDVGRLVLRDNELQTLALALEASQAMSLLPVHQRFMQRMESEGKLSRRLEYLPGDSQLLERVQNHQALTRPELAVLLAYAKIVLYQDLLASPLPDDARWDSLLVDYFPALLAERFGSRLADHPLRREIIATVLTNHVVNRQGISFVFRLAEETEQTPATVVQAWMAATRLLDSETIALRIEAAAGIAAETRFSLLLALRRHTERATRWALRQPDIVEDGDFARVVAAEFAALAGRQLCVHTPGSALVAWLDAGVGEALAGEVAAREQTGALFDLARDAAERASVGERMALYLGLGELIGFDWLTSAIERLPRDNRWQSLARLAARDDLLDMHAALTGRVWLATTGDVVQRLEQWQLQSGNSLQQWLRMLAELREAAPDLAMISAALRELRGRLVG
ncbi:glutamate dehydrogenase [Andreprevotia lacus DSM 23236]|jgi:glutamate dehydrogenase|uniref:Glutamate dehydrogenase n=1 Tax=Andreprevotia lacus DSM 23236 TaxID=1121001 RepID=A0A1W1XIP7_9NEIS|nr:NAD-glutamate dehydrogenase [Andreprevotia lacus]SMC23856.1 glutamate dehydrogenase [Andreprevotia lacus DSM 23236]